MSGWATADPTSIAGWDERLRRYPHADIFHSAAWSQVLRDAYGYRPCFLVQPSALAGGHVPGVDFECLPLAEVRSFVTGKRGVSLPFTDFCAPLVQSAASLESAKDAAIAYGRERGWRYVELRGTGGYDVPWTPSFIDYRVHTLDLTGTEDAIFAKCESSVRRAVRKAQRSGVTCEIAASGSAVRSFYRLHCRTRREHGLPPQPFRFFRSMQEHLLAAGHGFVALASAEGRPVAGAVFLRFGDRAVFKFAASDHHFQSLRPANLAMWDGIVRCRREGCRSLHMGRTSLHHEGLRRFKLGWGAEEGTLSYYCYNVRRGAFVKGRDASSGWHNHLFRLIPVRLSPVVGNLLYKHVG